MSILRRARGALIRLVRRRKVAFALGLCLTIPAAWVEFDSRISAWWIDGLSLVAGATGIAFMWTALTGPSPDWTE